MAVNSGENYLNDPLFKSAMQNLQLGNWQEGLQALNQLVENYPFSQDLRLLRQDMQTRARIDDDERVDQIAGKRQRLIKTLFRVALIVLVVAAVVWGINAYSAWIQGQLVKAGQQIEGEMLNVELAVKFRNGQNFMLAGRMEEALTLFQEVAAIDAKYPGLDAAMEQIDKTQSMEKKYMQALSLIDANDLDGALGVLEDIKSEDPYYKDVSIRINAINNQFFLADLVAQAEKAYQKQNWAEAASGYETIRAIDPQYDQDKVEERLLNSYMNAAYTALEADTSSFEALESAEGYYRKALALRPQDPNVTLERERTRQSFRESLSLKYVDAAVAALGNQTDSIEALQVAEEYFRKAFALTPNNKEVESQYTLAKGYLLAQEEFTNEHYDTVIDTLEAVYEIDPEYASGTARQTLYEAHIARGNEIMAGGEYLLALNDFQRAAVIAEKNSRSILSLYAAKIKVGEAYGALTNYEDATFNYQDALDLIDLSLIKDKDFNPTRAKLEEADRLAEYRYFRQAYKLYKEAAPKVLTSVSAISHIVESEDYLTSLANRYHTTVDAIISVNNLISPKEVQVGQELIIPGVTP